ncbi:hypothetical protein, partial [Streptomyces sp. NRRL F-5135]|uniref:hypothetical protein n=1 Tax=Streptomyces sp. NRRL F-5135 TaxID=1463858 RepID=UPI0005689E47
QIYNKYFDDKPKFTDHNKLPGPNDPLGTGDSKPPVSEKPYVSPGGANAKGTTVKSDLFTPGPAPLPNTTVSSDLPDGIGSGLNTPPPPPYSPP